VPFIVAWGQYKTVLSERPAQAHFLSAMVFVDYPLRFERKNPRKAWFQKAMRIVVPSHAAVVAGMWFVDAATKTQWHAGSTVVSICATSAIIDFVGQQDC
jgi:hypothetical protein